EPATGAERVRRHPARVADVHDEPAIARGGETGRGFFERRLRHEAEASEAESPPLRFALELRQSLLPPAAPAADPAGEQRDEPEDGQDGGDDEEPVDREADAESDDREKSQDDQQQHAFSPPRIGGSGGTTKNAWVRLRLPPPLEPRLEREPQLLAGDRELEPRPARLELDDAHDVGSTLAVAARVRDRLGDGPQPGASPAQHGVGPTIVAPSRQAWTPRGCRSLREASVAHSRSEYELLQRRRGAHRRERSPAGGRDPRDETVNGDDPRRWPLGPSADGKPSTEGVSCVTKKCGNRHTDVTGVVPLSARDEAQADGKRGVRSERPSARSVSAS